mgnify:CR=1 FL=1
MCFANTHGGTLAVGVRDSTPGPEAFVGSHLDPTQTLTRIYGLTDPGLIVTVDRTMPGPPELTIPFRSRASSSACCS